MKILKILLIFFAIINFSKGDLVNEHFGTKFKVGVSRFAGKKLHIKVIDGDAKIQYDNKSEDINQGQILTFVYKFGSMYYNDIKVEEVFLKKMDIITMFGLKKDGERFYRYRGDFEIIKYNSIIWPVNIITAEEYLYSVVPSEIGFNFHEEAIKAQSVAARTYLYNGLASPKYEAFDLMDDTNSQMYLGYEHENPKIRYLVNETSKEIITYNGKPINAVYHSTSGGKTANNEDVWKYSKRLPYLRTVDDKNNGSNSPRENWSYQISKKNLSNKFNFDVEDIIISEKKDLRAKKVLIKGKKIDKVITGNEFRRILGYTNIFSTIFKIKRTRDNFIFEGNGSGHGVGMSQWGANGLANQGKDYRYILNYYYTDVQIKTLKN